MNVSAIRHIWWRQLHYLLSNPVCYIFILAFCLIAASFQFIPLDFYTRNICDLQALQSIMPWLAAVFIPALAMNAWAGERELHTDELLLTLPINSTDIVIGKWLGLCSYWCLALVASLSNVIVLYMLGTPDFGLLLAQYVSWFLYGCILSATALMASCLSNNAPIAFILGSIISSAVVALLFALEFGEHAMRGRLHLSAFLISFCLCAAGLCLSIIILSSKRWYFAQRSFIIKNIIVVTLSLIVLFNIAVIAQRSTSAIDITDEQISSLSTPSLQVIDRVENNVHIHAFIQKELPDPYHVKGEELLDILSGIKSINNPNIHIDIHRPQDSLDASAELALKHYGIKAKRVQSSGIVGGQSLDVFLGLSIHSGNRKHIIPFIEHGMGIEYQIIRALHVINKERLPRLGIVSNAFPLLAHHDYRSDRMRPDSPIIKEWRKRFDVREVFLGETFQHDVDVLVVPMVSLLDQDKLNILLAYLRQGGRALLFEDPAPMWSDIELAASFSRDTFYQARGLPRPQNIKNKGDANAFYQALGIHIPLDNIIWSNDNPSFRLRQMWPESIVWSRRSERAIPDHIVSTGIDQVLFPFPGHILAIPSAQTALKPLLSTAMTNAFGKHKLSDYVTHSESQGFRHHQPQNNRASEGYAILAAEISGIIAQGNKECQAIVIADSDFMHDQFYELYSKAQPEFHDDDLALIRRLQNFQFIDNCLDLLCADTELLSIRTRQLRYRSLEYIETIQRQKQSFKNIVFDETRDNTLAEQEKAKDFQTQLLSDIQQRDDLDDQAKEQLFQAQLAAGRASFEERLVNIKRQEAEKFKNAELLYRRAIDNLLNNVRLYALLIPGIALSFLAFCIWLVRYRQERALIPGQRLRERQS